MIDPFRTILVVHNPSAGTHRTRRVDALIRGLRGAGRSVEAFGTTKRGDAEDAARQAGRRGFDLVVAAGGDGTVNEVANGLALSTQAVPFALLPMGTANVLAAEIGLPCHPQALLGAIAGGRIRPIRLGVAAGRHFVLMASVGADAAVVHGINLLLKRHAGRLAYAVEALRQGMIYDYPPLEVRVDGVAYAARMVVACNASRYGGPFVAAPGAALDDGLLHAVLMEGAGPGALLRYGIALAAGRLSRLPDVKIVAGSVIAVECPRNAPVQADGDPIGMLPVTLAVSDKIVEMVVP